MKETKMQSKGSPAAFPLTGAGTDRAYTACCIAILLLAALLRLYRLGDVPFGFHADELALSYNAFSIANYRTDAYLNWMPLFPQNTIGGQCAFTTYAVALCYRLFGRSPMTLRLPLALLGILTVFFGMRILRRAFGKKAALAGGALLAASPYFLLQCRFALDCNAMVGMMTISFACLLRALEARKTGWFLLTGFLYGVALYTYGLSFIVLPVFLLLTAGYLLYTGAATWKHLLAAAIPLVILAVPCVLFVLVGTLGLEPIQTPLFTINAVARADGGDFGLGAILPNFITIWENILFKDWLPYNAFAPYYTFYIVSVPFFLIGIVKAVGSAVRHMQARRMDVSALICFWFLAEFLLGLILVGQNGPNINRLNGIFFPAAYFIVCGLRAACLALKSKAVRRVFLVGTAACYLGFAALFVRYYFHHFSLETTYGAEYSALDYREAYAYLIENDMDVDVYCDQEPINYYGLHDDLPPAFYQSGNLAASPARLRVHAWYQGERAVSEGNAAYILRDVNTAAADRLLASPYADRYERIDFGRYTMFLAR